MTYYTNRRNSISLIGANAGLIDIGFKVGIFALLTAVGALIRFPVPFSPVPITMQTYFVILAGVMLGAKRGALSQGIYVALGALGLPIFSSMAAGVAWLGGPTGGYIIGFIAAPAVVAYIAGNNPSRQRVTTALIAGTAVIFAFGVSWLAIITDGTALDVIKTGFLPFLPGAVIKIGLALATVELIGTIRNKK